MARWGERGRRSHGAIVKPMITVRNSLCYGCVHSRSELTAASGLYFAVYTAVCFNFEHYSYLGMYRVYSRCTQGVSSQLACAYKVVPRVYNRVMSYRITRMSDWRLVILKRRLIQTDVSQPPIQ